MPNRESLTIVVLALGLSFGSTAGAGPEVRALHFETGHFLLSASETPPSDAEPWQRVQLTDVWRDTRPDAHGRGWYRFEFDLETKPGERWAAYLPGLASNAAVYVNGEFVGDGGRMREPVSINSNRPLFFPFSPALLEAGRNRLDIALFAHRGSWDRLEPVRIGPARELEPRHEREFFWHITLSQLASGLAVALLPFMGAIWLGAGRDPLYGWFLVVAGAWSVAGFNYHVQVLPVRFWTWEAIVHSSLDAAAVAGVLVVHRLVEIRQPRFERAILLLPIVAFATQMLTTGAEQSDWSLRFHMLSFALVAYAVTRVASRRRLLQGAEFPVFLLATLGFIGVAGHDLAIQFGGLDMDAPRLLPLGSPLILVAFAACLTARFFRDHRRAERSSVELEGRVREKQAELESNYGRMARLERESALSRERERIVREVHDGMGGKIVSSLALLETGRSAPARIAATLRESLDDMRLLIQSLEPESGELDALLGMIRERLDQRLDGHGLRIEWRVGELPEGLWLSPENSLHVLRIVEEAFTNVLKHAEAQRVMVSTESAADGVTLRICDDGVGARSDHSGVGLRSMRERARALGGRLEIAYEERGTVVALWIPFTVNPVVG